MQEFDEVIKDKKGSKILVADHLSRLEFEDNGASQVHINDSFPDEQLLALSHTEFTSWFADLRNYLAVEVYRFVFPIEKEILRGSQALLLEKSHPV